MPNTSRPDRRSPGPVGAPAPEPARGPQRTCIGCRRVGSPDTLVRVASGAHGGIVVGRSAPGRGAWLCAGSVECFDRAVRRRAFSRALRTDIRAEALAELRRTLFDPVVET